MDNNRCVNRHGQIDYIMFENIHRLFNFFVFISSVTENVDTFYRRSRRFSYTYYTTTVLYPLFFFIFNSFHRDFPYLSFKKYKSFTHKFTFKKYQIIGSVSRSVEHLLEAFTNLQEDRGEVSLKN